MSSRPDIQVEQFPIQVAVWKKERDGKTYYSTKLSRRYKDDEAGEWKDTQYLNTSDLLVAAALLQEAWRRINGDSS